MNSYFLEYKSSVIHYCKSADHGRPVLLCLHGYGGSTESFFFLEERLSADYTLIAVDLPFHGKTTWRDGLDCTAADLWRIIKEIMTGCIGETEKITTIGFSMGCRVQLMLLQTMPDNVKKIFCCSPDGLYMHGSYRFATQTRAGNRILKTVLQYPGGLLKLLKALRGLHLVGRQLYAFVIQHLQSPQTRADLYNRWMVLRAFKPDLSIIKKLLLQNNIRVDLLYGQDDRITRFRQGEAFVRGMEGLCLCHIIPSGHFTLQEKNIEHITALLQH